jgi:predicted secreted protein
MMAFQDKRSGRIALLAHCLLNQNAKVAGLAQYPAMVKSIIDVLEEAGIGMIQLPCPEAEHLGLCRPKGEDTKEQYDCPEYRATCTRLSQQVVHQVRQYMDSNYKVVCILGVEGSPSCSVETVPTRKGLVSGSGIFIEVLLADLRCAGLDVAIIGIPEGGELSDTLSRLRQVVQG